MWVEKSNEQIIHDLSDDDKRLLKTSLTYDNPKYKAAKTFGRSMYISIPPYLTYYSEEKLSNSEKVLKIPISYDLRKFFQNEFLPIRDNRIENFVSYPPFRLELREDQQYASTCYLNELETSEYPKSIVQLPTGKGKTILALYLAQKLGQKTLVLVHKDDLVVGWKKIYNYVLVKILK